MTKDEIGDMIAALPQGLEPDELIYRLVNWAVDNEREACADVADIALLGCERSIRDRVVRAIRARGDAIEFEEMVKKGTKAWADTPDDWVDDLRGGAEKQEPVAWFIQYEYRHEFLWREPTAHEKNSALEVKPLYAAPPKSYDPMERNADYERGFIDGRADQMKSSVDRAVNRMAQREWVGLTVQESEELWDKAVDHQEHFCSQYADFADAIEAKLKEKNN